MFVIYVIYLFDYIYDYILIIYAFIYAYRSDSLRHVRNLEISAIIKREKKKTKKKEKGRNILTFR